jgi:hypothetical protein
VGQVWEYCLKTGNEQINSLVAEATNTSAHQPVMSEKKQAKVVREIAQKLESTVLVHTVTKFTSNSKAVLPRLILPLKSQLLNTQLH